MTEETDTAIRAAAKAATAFLEELTALANELRAALAQEMARANGGKAGR